MRDHIVALLDPYLEKHRHLGFHYGVVDCVLFAAGWVEIATGKNPLPIAVDWSDEQTAYAALASVGASRVSEAVDLVLPRRELLRARIGDILSFDGQVGEVLGICTGDHGEFLTAFGRMRPNRLSACKLAWSVL